MPTIRYVDAQAGSDTNSGQSDEQAWASLGTAISRMPSSDWILYCRGTFREAAVSVDSKTNWQIRPTIADESFALLGFEVIDGGDWTDSGSGYFTTTISSPVSMVSDGYDDLYTEDRPDCFIKQAVDAATCQSTPGTFHWNSGTGLLTVHPGASNSDPTEGGYCWHRGDNAFAIRACSTFILDGLRTYGWFGCDSSGTPDVAYGYGILVGPTGGEDSHDGVVQNCAVSGYGGHGIGAVTGVYNITVLGCVMRTCRQGKPDGTGVGATAFVFHSNAGNNANELRGLIASGCTAHMDGVRDVDGTLLYTNGIDGFYTHGGGAIFPFDVAFERCIVQCYDDTLCQLPFSAGVTDNPSLNTTTELVPSNYPVRFTRCVLRSGQGNLHNLADPANDTQSIAFDRCDFQFTNVAKTSATYAIHNEGIGRHLYRACRISTDRNAAFRMFDLSRTNRVVLANCQLYHKNTAASAAHRFFYANHNTVEIRSVGTVYRMDTASAQLIAGAVELDDAKITFTDNWYSGFVSATGYNNTDTGSTSKSAAQWTANIDPGGVYGTDPQLSVSSLADIKPTVTSAVRTTRDATPPTGRIHEGFNDRHYSGHYGCFQWGSPHSFMSRRHSRRGTLCGD